MRGKVIISACVLMALAAYGQKRLSITPFIGINSTKMNMSDATYQKYERGGNFFLMGFETQVLLTDKSKRFGVSALTGASYLANGYRSSGGIKFSDLFYSYRSIDLTQKYVQLPIVLKLNWQPLPLIEDFNLFVGAGINFNLLQKAKLTEEAIEYFDDFDVMDPPPVTNRYSDQGDITDMGRPVSLFRRWEVGINYKRVQVSWRITTSMQDMYYSGLENNWNVPQGNSIYLSARDMNGKIREKYVEIVLGYRLF
jgi:hypothetical protein